MADRGLSETYDAVRDDVREVLELHQSIWGGDLSLPRRLLYRRSPPAMSLYLDGGSSIEEALLRHQATPEQRAHRLFPILCAPHFVEAVALHVRSVHGLTGEQAKALQELHEAVDEQEKTVSSILQMRSRVGTVIAVVALVATQVPKETLALLGVGDRGYGVYRLWLFQLLVAGVLFVLLAGYFRELAVRFQRATVHQHGAGKVVGDQVQWSHISYVLRLVLLECALVERFPVEDEQPVAGAAAPLGEAS